MSWFGSLFRRRQNAAPVVKETLTTAVAPSPADARFARCLPIILKHEGGFVDHPADPGGATNFGISLRYMRSKGSMWDLDGDGDVDRDDVLRVTVAKAGVAYRNWFWNDVRGDELPAGLDLAMFDYAVNSGSARPIRALQRHLRIQADGVFGPATMAAMRASPNYGAAVRSICDERMTFLKGLKTWPTFGRGWERRVNDVRSSALVMI